jgi:hypothetical protein
VAVSSTATGTLRKYGRFQEFGAAFSPSDDDISDGEDASLAEYHS